MAEFDRGPTDGLAALFARVPDPPVTSAFWFDWGPVFYRGRLDGSARVLIVASDPGPTERIAGRSLVGNAGQRVQGFLTKLGLTRSYVCLNAWAYALHPGEASAMEGRLGEPAQRQWRNSVFDRATDTTLQAVVAMGFLAQEAVRLWTARPPVTLVEVPHPSNPNTAALLDAWRDAVALLRPLVTPDEDGDNTGPTYGTAFEESDYGAIPRRDLPFGAPAFLGDDAWVRAGPGGAQNAVRRPSPDDGHTLIWKAPG
ncbi:uracil-DNA glycosylase [Streptomyces sulfonofaciens]|uniref:Uracil-DNA glycosylase n=1 Tax=Streptomyces sulfonofaciens TaxID=68272 RepID=A0A919FU67_9ACTN|nr:uracil-DNA glycosylase family protein [Streptomyces sulfonofaciens]GHH72470.1 uracil-DNA glycosylase [Streptomyces sulfonofaciens]